MSDDIPDLTDDAEWPDVRLGQWRTAIRIEQDRRRVIEQSADEAAALNERYAEAVGRKNGDTWRQPSAAHDAYGLDAEVIYEGKRWRSLLPMNVWKPGISGWREVVDPGPNPAQPDTASWKQPLGAHDAYAKGDEVTYQGKRWRSTIDANVWSPHTYGWSEVTDQAPTPGNGGLIQRPAWDRRL